MTDWSAVWDTGGKPRLSDLENRIFAVRLRGICFLLLWGNIKRTWSNYGINHWGFSWGSYTIIERAGDKEIQLSYDVGGNNWFVQRFLDGLRKITAPHSIPGTPDFIGELRFRFWKKHRLICRFTLTQIAPIAEEVENS